MGKTGRIILKTLLVLFVLVNVIAGFHAYKFTHFTSGAKKSDGHKAGGGEILKAMLFGINIPRPVDFATPAEKYDTVYLQSNVKLECWNMKADNAKGTVIIFHGYGNCKSNMIDRSDEFLKLGYNTLLVDFMGSGGSEGNSTTIGYDEGQEVKAAYDYVAGKGEKHIFLFGTSMGAASITKAMSDYKLNATGLMLECPFGTMLQAVDAKVRMMGLHKFPTTYLLMFWGGTENGFWAFKHNPEEYAKTIKTPTLLMWGQGDERVSRGEIDNIYNNLQGKKDLKTFPLCKHEDYIPKYHDLWVNDVASFLQSTNL